jgi:hypothetical protein
MPVILSGRRVGGGRSSPGVGIAQSADLGTVVIYLGECAGDEVRGRVRGTRRVGNASRNWLTAAASAARRSADGRTAAAVSVRVIRRVRTDGENPQPNEVVV